MPSSNMPQPTLTRALLPLLLACALTAPAQQKGNWRASNSTAKSITGDIVLSDEKIAINFATFPIARIRALQPDEITALFEADTTTPGIAALYKLEVPAAKKFLHKNSLCGAEDTQWMVTYLADRSLHLALFSGSKPPVLAPEAIANSTDLCGTFTYTR